MSGSLGRLWPALVLSALLHLAWLRHVPAVPVTRPVDSWFIIHGPRGPDAVQRRLSPQSLVRALPPAPWALGREQGAQAEAVKAVQIASPRPTAVRPRPSEPPPQPASTAAGAGASRRAGTNAPRVVANASAAPSSHRPPQRFDGTTAVAADFARQFLAGTSQSAAGQRQRGGGQRVAGGASGAPGGRSRSPSFRRWYLRQQRRVQRRLRFPKPRQLAMDQGTALYRLRLGANGHLLRRPQLWRSSGHADLDAAALAALLAAHPFEPPPPALLRAEPAPLTLFFAIHFLNPLIP